MIFRARLRLTPSEAGGRTSPIASGYRATFVLDPDKAPPAVHSALVTLVDSSTLAPGEEGLVELVPASPEAWGSVQADDVLAAKEGLRTVGHATIDG